MGRRGQGDKSAKIGAAERATTPGRLLMLSTNCLRDARLKKLGIVNQTGAVRAQVFLKQKAVRTGTAP